MPSPAAHYVLNHPWPFVRRVINGFRANQGFLLAGAVAYYTLLSLVPMFALILVALSQFQDQQELLETLRNYLVLIAPGQVDALIHQISVFMTNWKLVGIMGLLILLFFSSLAFSALENAMSVIFFHRVAIQRRHILVSAIIPYGYILLLALGMLLVSMVSGGLHSLDTRSVSMLGHTWSLSGTETVLIYLLGVFGEILLLTSLYMVMPVGRLSLRHALIGGVTAALLWEVTRHVLVWYFSTLSLVNVVYGAFATVIIILLSLEAAAIILLLGAQVIAEYERIENPTPTSHGLQT
ncbi:MAG: YihY/virulence factor BrkB family protein [Proteobacteria bacterium]|jgi:YihY family inner membrane protein|nr:YihY/virulence factor BrkB family protein [Pseudomonadota bacterium]